jgi:hypothetical protein
MMGSSKLAHNTFYIVLRKDKTLLKVIGDAMVVVVVGLVVVVVVVGLVAKNDIY